MKTTLLIITFAIGLMGISNNKAEKIEKKEAFIEYLTNPSSSCDFKNKQLFGKVQFVNAHPDIKIQYVDAFYDLRVQMVNSNPNSCGKWQEVSSGADIKVQIVNSFPDLKVLLVTSNPGMK